VTPRSAVKPRAVVPRLGERQMANTRTGSGRLADSAGSVSLGVKPLDN